MINLLGLEEAKPVMTPSVKRTLTTESPVELEGERRAMYRTVVGKLLYMRQERADVMYSVKESARENCMSNRERRDEFDSYCEILERRSECKEPERNHYTSEVRDRVHRQRLGRPSNNAQKLKWRSCEVGNATLTAWSRTQQTVSLSSAEAELNALTTGVAEGMVTKHLLQEWGHEVILMKHVDSQSAKAWASKTWKNETM